MNSVLKEVHSRLKKKVGKEIQVEYGVGKSMEESTGCSGAWWVRAGGVAARGKVRGVAGTWSPRAVWPLHGCPAGNSDPLEDCTQQVRG